MGKNAWFIKGTDKLSIAVNYFYFEVFYPNISLKHSIISRCFYSFRFNK